MKILVVEDDRKIKTEIIDDVLASLGHGSDWAQNQQEAKSLVTTGQHDLVLLDLQIPSRPSGRPSSEFGKHLLRWLHEHKGPDKMPVILMTGYHQDCVDMATDLHEIGVDACISKPFPQTGRTLAAVIEDVMAKHRRSRQVARARKQDQPLVPFTGGVLAFYPNHVTLCGETIVEKSHKGYGWGILNLLRDTNSRGSHVRLGSRHLARKLHPNLSQNTLIQSIKALRDRIAAVMAERLGQDCGTDDVIANGGKGYHLRDWITVEAHDEGRGAAIKTGHRDAGDAPPALSQRQQWILAQLAGGRKLTCRQVEEEFSISPKTAKRELAGLSQAGMIDYDRSGSPGFYRLR